MIRAVLALLLFALPALAADLSGLATVVDGDTIRVQGQTVRIWGISASEMDTREGRDAARFLTAFLGGKSVSCRDTGGRTWGRVVGQCFSDGQDIAMVMVCAGKAVDWPKFSKGAYARCRQ